MKIFKYPCNFVNDQLRTGHCIANIELPLGAEILHIGLQKGSYRLWVRCDPSREKVWRVFGAFFTGCDVPENAVYLNTILTWEDSMVVHLFELK